MSSYSKEMQPASMETQPPPIQRGKQGLSGSQGLSLNSRESRHASVNLDDVSTTTTTGGDSPTIESLHQPIDPRRDSEDHAASPTPQGEPTMTDKLQGKAQKIAGKMSRNTELYEKGEMRESGQ